MGAHLGEPGPRSVLGRRGPAAGCSQPGDCGRRGQMGEVGASREPRPWV